MILKRRKVCFTEFLSESSCNPTILSFISLVSSHEEWLILSMLGTLECIRFFFYFQKLYWGIIYKEVPIFNVYINFYINKGWSHLFNLEREKQLKLKCYQLTWKNSQYKHLEMLDKNVTKVNYICGVELSRKKGKLSRCQELRRNWKPDIWTLSTSWDYPESQLLGWSLFFFLLILFLPLFPLNVFLTSWVGHIKCS